MSEEFALFDLFYRITFEHQNTGVCVLNIIKKIYEHFLLLLEITLRYPASVACGCDNILFYVILTINFSLFSSHRYIEDRFKYIFKIKDIY